MNPVVDYTDFAKVDIRTARIIKAEAFPQARRPAYKLTLDFGPELGLKKSSAQITAHYQPADLVGRTVMAVTNLAPKQIGPFISECLTLGFADDNGDIVLAVPERATPLGSKLF